MQHSCGARKWISDNNYCTSYWFYSPASSAAPQSTWSLAALASPAHPMTWHAILIQTTPIWLSLGCSTAGRLSDRHWKKQGGHWRYLIGFWPMADCYFHPWTHPSTTPPHSSVYSQPCLSTHSTYRSINPPAYHWVKAILSIGTLSKEVDC